MHSDAQQDEFAIRINDMKTNGHYIDIGSCWAISHNNTAMLDKRGWKGICVESNVVYNHTYSERSCTLINHDATQLDYKTLFESHDIPNTIDYLSLDVDQLSLTVLKILPHENYRFRCITIEHDAYLHGDTYRKQQREFLASNGYHLLCSNVFVEQLGYEGKQYPFEDWWIDPRNVDISKFSQIQCDSEFPTKIISKFQR